MGSRSEKRRRSSPETRAGRIRADAIATRLGVALREARRDAGRTQASIGDAASVSQALVSGLERGHGASSSLETWACLAAAVGEQLVVFLERAPGAHRPRDIEHLRRQSAVVELARAGNWVALPELAIDPSVARSRSIDVALVRRATQEAIVVEVWDWFDDVGAALRGLDGKEAALRRRLASLVASAGASGPSFRPPVTPTPGLALPAGAASAQAKREAVSTRATAPDEWRVGGLFVVRGTRRNRGLVEELRPLFAARFRGSAALWLRALLVAGTPMPTTDGLLWSDSGGRLRASRLGRG